MRRTTLAEAQAEHEDATRELAQLTAGFAGLPPENPTEEELQRHVDDCVANWSRIMGDSVSEIEEFCVKNNITLRQIAEQFVREWFSQKVRVL